MQNNEGAQKIPNGTMLDEIDLKRLKSILVEFRPTDKESCYDVKWVMKLKSKQMLKLGINMRT